MDENTSPAVGDGRARQGIAKALWNAPCPNSQNITSEQDLLGAALDYAARSWLVFPCRQASKEPACTHGFYNATTNPATIRRYWLAQADYNPAVRTGIMSGVWVLDVDGAIGAAALAKLEAKYGPLPSTLTSVTSAGSHLWWCATGPIQSSAGRVGLGLDVRGEGGYVLAPPSVHPDGPVYRWINVAPPVLAPAWLVALTRPRPPTPSLSIPALSISARAIACRSLALPGAYGKAALEYEITALASAPTGHKQSCAQSRRVQPLSTCCWRRARRRRGSQPADRGLVRQWVDERSGRWTGQRQAHDCKRCPCWIAAPPSATGDVMTELRPYQEKVIEDFSCVRASGNNRIILVAPTGSGKTIVAAAIIKAAVASRKRVLVLAHRREIVAQTSQKLQAHGIPHGIIQAGIPERPLETRAGREHPDTARARRPQRSHGIAATPICWSSTRRTTPRRRAIAQIIDAYPDAILLGLTATPCRGDGRGLGGIFEVIIECPQVAELIEHGYLVKTRVYAPIDPDLKGVRTVAGDYNEGQLADRMDRPKLIGDIVTHWHKYGERRKTVAFAVNVAHSLHLRDEFVKSGVRAEHIDGGTPKPERDASLARLASGEIELISNCMVLTEGWDMPEVGCCILARPTKKMGLYRQMIGRVLRPAEGKPDAIILDHSGAVFRHGFAEDPVEWTLDPDRRSESADARRALHRRITIAAAGMHAMRRHQDCRRAVQRLRIPAAAAAASGADR